MHLLFVAPGISPPWTEGRKKFVRELLAQLKNQNVTVDLLTSSDAKTPNELIAEPNHLIQVKHRHKLTQLVSLHYALREYLSANKPGAVVQFPFGTFDGIRGIANRTSLQQTSRICRKANIPSLAVLYSVTSGSLNQIAHLAGSIACTQGPDWNGPIINTGINMEEIPVSWQNRGQKKLLFMAGYSENNESLLHAILYERGLIDVILCGESLASQGLTLCIAIPLLQHPTLLEKLNLLIKTHAPSLTVEMRTFADPKEIFSECAMFIFPYRRNLTRFTPTSMLEAMAAGIPIVASRLSMYSSLIGAGDVYCNVYEATDANGLAHAITRAMTHWDATCSKAEMAQIMVRTQFDIKLSAQHLLTITTQLMCQQRQETSARHLPH